MGADSLITTSAKIDDIRTACLLGQAFRQAQLAIAGGLARYELSGLEYYLLLRVSAAGEEGIIQGALVGEMKISKTGVSLLVRNLWDSRLIETIRSKPDRRRVRVRLTRRGRQVSIAALRSMQRAIAKLVTEMPADDVSAMAELALKACLGLEAQVSFQPRRGPARLSSLP